MAKAYWVVCAHDSPGYQEALRALGNDACERDLRIVEGVA